MPTKIPKVLCHFCQREFVDIRKHYRRNAECNRQYERAKAEAQKLRQQLEAEALKPKETNRSSHHEDQERQSNSDESNDNNMPFHNDFSADSPYSNSDQSSSLSGYMEQITQTEYFKDLQDMLDQQSRLDSSRQSDSTTKAGKEPHDKPNPHKKVPYPSTIHVDLNSDHANNVPPLSNSGPYDGGPEIGLPGRDMNMFPDHNPPSPIDPKLPPEDVTKKRKYTLVDGNSWHGIKHTQIPS
jgi:hypothetical protein